MRDRGCPPPAELTAFAAGHLPAADMDRVADHLLGCAGCQTALGGEGGSVLAALRDRSAGGAAAPPPDPAAATLVRPAAPAPWPGGPTPRFDSELRDLLHYRLKVYTAVGLVGFYFFLLEYLAEPLSHTVSRRGWDWRDQGLLILAVAVGTLGAAVVWLRPRLALAQLRAVEVILVATTSAYLAGARYVTLAAAGAGVPADPAVAGLYVEHATLLSNLGWVFHLAFYGLLIPNTWRRCVTVVGCMAVVPVVVTVLAAQVNPAAAAKLPMLVGVTTVGVVLAGLLAVFGSFKISTLQQEVFAARQEARELGQYRLGRRLGAGGMGEVYLAEHRLLKRPCAVKLIRPRWAADPDYLRRFEREVQATARLRHPHTVEIYDYGHAPDGTFYYVMEYLPGMTLEEAVKRHGPLPAARVVHLLRQLCSALRTAHGVGLIHRDIKPSNVILCPDGVPHDRVKLLDFGLVRPVGKTDGASRLTDAGLVVGTPEYMSPEQAEGAAGIDGRSDLYSLGALAYFLLSGRPPFTASSSLQVLIAHVQAPVPPLHAVCPGVPAALEAVVLRCLAKSATERFADAAVLDHALAGCREVGTWAEEDATAWWKATTTDGPPPEAPGGVSESAPAETRAV